MHLAPRLTLFSLPGSGLLFSSLPGSSHMVPTASWLASSCVTPSIHLSPHSLHSDLSPSHLNRFDVFPGAPGQVKT